MKNYKDNFSGAEVKFGTSLSGVYKIIHLKSGKFYIGSTGNFATRRWVHINQLRRQVHDHPELQKLYNEDPNFKFEFWMTGSKKHDTRARELAYSHEQDFLNQYKSDPLLLNKSITAKGVTLSGEKQIERIKKFRKNVSSDSAKKKHSESMKLYSNTEEGKERRSVLAKLRWKNPKYVEKMNEVYKSETNKEKLRKSLNKLWSDPTRREELLKKRRDPKSLEKALKSKIAAGRIKRVEINGQIYDSMLAAAKALKMNVGSIRYNCLNAKVGYRFID